MFYETDKQELVLAKLLCMDAGKDRPRLMKCHELGGSQVQTAVIQCRELFIHGKAMVPFVQLSTNCRLDDFITVQFFFIVLKAYSTVS